MIKHSKFGFTLVEALVAMAIVGSVAAIVLPPLIAGAQNRKHAASLGRSVELIETGCQRIIQDYNNNTSNPEKFKLSQFGLTSIFNSHTDRERFGVSLLGDDERSTYTASIQPYNNDEELSPAIADMGNDYVVNPNIGAYYWAYRLIHSVATDDKIVEMVFIDVNGGNSPNKYGKDIFAFGLTNRCHMIPAGTSRVYSEASIPTEANGCNGTGSSITNGLSCTSRVVKDGYRIEYDKS